MLVSIGVSDAGRMMFCFTSLILINSKGNLVCNIHARKLLR